MTWALRQNIFLYYTSSNVYLGCSRNRNFFLISYNEKRFLKSHPITIFTFQRLKIKVTLVMVCFVNL